MSCLEIQASSRVVVCSFLGSADDGDADFGLHGFVPPQSGIAALFVVLGSHAGMLRKTEAASPLAPLSALPPS
jgi:hypothetical protein